MAAFKWTNLEKRDKYGLLPIKHTHKILQKKLLVKQGKSGIMQLILVRMRSSLVFNFFQFWPMVSHRTVYYFQWNLESKWGGAIHSSEWVEFFVFSKIVSKHVQYFLCRWSPLNENAHLNHGHSQINTHSLDKVALTGSKPDDII